MGKLKLSILVAFSLLSSPALLSAGQDPVGACFVVGDFADVFGEAAATEGKFNLAGCADGLTEAECTSVDVLTEFWEGATCADVADKGGFDWDGSCLAGIPPLGDLCVVLWTELGPPVTQGLCEKDLGGTWFNDLECGAPVPTMPGFGLAVMALLILGGALILLTMRGSLPTS